jgi:hypothetical protein
MELVFENTHLVPNHHELEVFSNPFRRDDATSPRMRRMPMKIREGESHTG